MTRFFWGVVNECFFLANRTRNNFLSPENVCVEKPEILNQKYCHSEIETQTPFLSAVYPEHCDRFFQFCHCQQ
jgi:hypothetical protein